MAHEVSQVNGPHTLCQLQLPACSLKVLIADWVEVPATMKYDRSVFLAGLLTLYCLLTAKLLSTYLRTILEQANPQSQWYSWRMTGTFSKKSSSEETRGVII